MGGWPEDIPGYRPDWQAHEDPELVDESLSPNLT